MNDIAQAIYRFLHEYIGEHHYAPSTREIAVGCQIGRGTVSRYLNSLEAQGRIIRQPGLARCIMLPTQPGKADTN